MAEDLSPDNKLCFQRPQKLSSLHEIDTQGAFISDKNTVSDFRAPNSNFSNGLSSELTVKDSTANINPLGLLAFGITGFLVNLSQTGLYPMSSLLQCFGLFFGGFGLLLTGIMEWKKNHMVNAVTYCTFGFFWICNIASGIFVKMGWGDAPDPVGTGIVLLIFGLFLFVLFFVNLTGPIVVKLIFFTAFSSFWIQGAGLIMGKPEKLSAWIGVSTCVMAIYAGFSEILQETYGTTILPLGPTFMRKKK